ncbi:unnamed protein product [Anisakis simplex]|uniref:WD_REPEATS_REGION domain-containing protein n=1 Tax=Anisakis simplex TaxID=6269 RepID=A0A0M3IYY5_ANISI|nr:unnamed protein product [Anisakis simplex]
MPCFTINTNVAADKVPADFLKKTSALIAKALSKPESYVATRINPGQQMTFGGSTDPCAICTLESIGAVGGARNNAHAEKLYKHIKEALGIPGNRYFFLQCTSASWTLTRQRWHSMDQLLPRKLRCKYKMMEYEQNQSSNERRTQSGGGKISKVRWINPEARQKIFVSGTYESADNKLTLWSIPQVSAGGDSFNRDFQLSVEDDVNDIVNCGSSSIGVALNNGDVLVIDADSDELNVQQTFRSVHRRCAANAVAAFEQRLVSGGADGSIVLFDLSQNGTASQPFVIASQMSSVRSLVMLTSNLLVSTHLCGRIYLWDLRDCSQSSSLSSSDTAQSIMKPSLVFHPTDTKSAIMTVAAHPADSQLISFGTEDGIIGFMDTRVTTECMAPISLPFSVGCINEIRFHPSYPDNIYCVSSEGVLIHLDATQQRVLQRQGGGSTSISRITPFSNANVAILMDEPLPLNSIDVCSDGVITGSDSHMITFIDRQFFV